MSAPVIHSFAGQWPDVCESFLIYGTELDAVVVRVDVDRTGPTPVIAFETVWRVHVGERPMFCRLAMAPDGELIGVCKGNATGAAILLRESGATVLGVAYCGDEAIAIAVIDGRVVVRWVESTTRLATFFLDNGEHRSDPLPPEHLGTSQGIRDLSPADGSVIYADDRRSIDVNGWTLYKPVQRAGVTVGQTNPAAIRVAVNGAVFTVLAVRQGEDPRLSVLASGRILVASYTNLGASLAIVDPPYPAHEIPIGFAFTHPVSVYPFKAEGSGAPDVFSLGRYTEAPTIVPADLPAHARLVIAHDALSDWTLPAGLRPWDLPLLELYRTPAETRQQSAARWVRQTQQLLAAWAGDVGVIPMFYDQLRWTVAQILEGLTWLSAVVNLSPRIKVIAPFAYNRANGVVAHAELQQAFAVLLDAARAAGPARLLPVAPSPPAPHPPAPTPKPQPAPTPAPIPVPLSEGDPLMLFDPQKTFLYVRELRPHETRKGLFTLVKPNGNVYSYRGGTNMSEQPINYDGGNETVSVSGNIATFYVNGEFASFAFAVVGALDQVPA